MSVNKYDVYETGFNKLEETICFGKRAIGGDKSVYEICTLAVIRSSESGLNHDTIQVSSYYKSENIIALGINNCLRLIKNTEVPDQIASFQFDHFIDAVSVSPCGKYLLCCTQSGQVCIRDLSSIVQEDNNDELPEKEGDIEQEDQTHKCIIAFDENIECNSYGDSIKCFIGAFADDSSECIVFYLVTSMGLVKKIQNTSGSFTSEIICDLKKYIKKCSFAFPFVCLESNFLYILDLRTNNLEHENVLNAKFLLPFGSDFLAIDDESSIFKIHAARCMIFNADSHLAYLRGLEQIMVLDDGESKYIVGVDKSLKLMPIMADNQYEYAPIYEIPLEDPIHLLNTKSFTEDIVFLTEIWKNKSLQEIRLQIVTKTDPESRIRKLIQKGLIDKAEVFAKIHNVNPEFLVQAKAENIVKDAQSTTQQIDMLLSILDSLDDVDLKMYYCEVVVCMTAADTRRVLSYAANLNIDVRDCKENENNRLLVKKRMFHAKLQLFDTFMQVYHQFDERKWQTFSMCNLINEVKDLLKQDRMEEAALLYSRLDPSSLTDDDIEDILSMLNTGLDNYKTFLNTFVPLSLKYLPNTLIMFVEWIESRVYELEGENEEYVESFPDCAIKFVKNMANLLNLYIPSQIFLGEEPRKRLSNLIISLKHIQLLIEKFFIKLPLCEYIAAPQNIVKTLLTLDLEPTHFENLMEEFLYPFMLECGVDTDDVLLKEIQSLFIYKEEYWINIVEVMLKFICRIDKKLEAIKDILEASSAPWNNNIKSKARVAFEHTVTSPVAKQIVELLNNEPVFVILEKYKVNKEEFFSSDEKEFYFHRIIYVNREDAYTAIQDIYQLCRKNEETQYANEIMIHEFIKRGNIEQAMKLLDSLEPTVAVGIIEKILEMLLFYFRERAPAKYRQAFYQALVPLSYRLIKFNKGYTSEKINYVYDLLNSLYGICDQFGIQASCSALKQKEKWTLVEQLFEKVKEEILEFETEAEKVDHLIKRCKLIGKLTKEDLEKILFKYIQTEDDFQTVVNICYFIKTSSDCPELLTQCAIYLFKYSKENFIEAQDETFLDALEDFKNQNHNSFDNITSLKLARELCIKALQVCETDRIVILEVLRWIDCFYLTDIDERVFVHGSHLNLYVPKSVRFGLSFEGFRTMFSILCPYSDVSEWHQLRLTGCRSRNFNNTLSQGELNRSMEQFNCNNFKLLRQGQQLTVLDMVSVVQGHLLHLSDIGKEFRKQLQHFITQSVLPEVISAVVSNKCIDKVLLVNLLSVYGESFQNVVIKYMELYKAQPKKLNILAQVGIHLLDHYGIKHASKDVMNILNLCKWWFKIDDSRMKYETYTLSKPEPRLEILIKMNKITLDGLPEFCEDFGLDLQGSYLKYLKLLLLNWDPDVQYITEENGKTNAIVKSTEFELMEKCFKVIERVSDKNEILKLTFEIWPLVNFYHYEVYLVLIAIRQRVSPSTTDNSQTFRALLGFLKKYRRIGNLTKQEIEQWYAEFPTKALIDPLSTYRLPLTKTFLSNQIWDIIKAEVNLDTYNDWLKVTSFLGEYLNQEDICTYAINNVLSAENIDRRCDTWQLSLKYNHLLPRVDQCAQHIKNLERATAAVYALVSGIPPGADKVCFAELSYKYVQLYREANPEDENVKKVFDKLEKIYFNFSAMHILYKYQLGEENYLKKVAQPSELIWELYNDPRIEANFDDLMFECPDINSAVKEICSLFDLRIRKETLNVLLKLLQSDFLLDFNCTRLRHGQANNLKRACYVCKNRNLNNWQKVLYEQGTKSCTENDITFKANALRCFYFVSSQENIKSITTMDYDDFVIFLEKTTIIATLSELGITIKSVEELDQQKHKKLLKILAVINKPLAIKCIASLCKIYELNDLKYWEYIVNTASQFYMVKEVMDYLEYLKGRCITDFIKNAWNMVFSDAIKQVAAKSYPSSEITLLLQSCPVIRELDLEPFIQQCEFSERFDIAKLLRNFSKNTMDEDLFIRFKLD
ncbi:uncharacterized protein LOC126738517 isoform X2 [Anthonomus grandis grandis]|uniref:uncharacterized protein LOC126738517 isoform X2 n=1 Tax=Anthonomus grandis grandis TaxID=2921223 RepID=UPI002166BE71|nr:uncharacterized protein LOC126738517 isoform X2 [Anthonomus grandis grandis]